MMRQSLSQSTNTVQEAKLFKKIVVQCYSINTDVKKKNSKKSVDLCLDTKISKNSITPFFLQNPQIPCSHPEGFTQAANSLIAHSHTETS